MTSRRRSSVEGAAARRLLAAANHERWQRLGVAVRGFLSLPVFQGTLCAEVGGWSEAEQRVWLEAALALAARSGRAAITYYREGPQAVRRLPAPLRAALLDALAVAAPQVDADELEVLVPVLGALVLDVAPTQRAAALELAARVAAVCPAGFPGLLRSLGRIVEEAGERLEEWTARGLALARVQPRAAHAYFALESRTGVRALHASPTAVALEEVEGVLRRYVHMLSGTPATVQPSAACRLRPPLEAAPAAGGVTLPAVIDTLETWEDNARLYRVLAAFLAARREFGTYADGRLAERLRADGRPAALEDCFLLADGFRVANRLVCRYPGIARDLEWAATTLLAHWSEERPDPSLLLDALLARSLAPADATEPSWLARVAALVRPVLAPLARTTATAGDALAVAELLATMLALPDARDDAAAPFPLAAEFYMAGDDEGPFARGGADAAEAAAASSDEPVPLSTETIVDLEVQLGALAERLTAAGRPLTAEEIARLLEAGVTPEFGPSNDPVAAEAGLFVTQLLGKLLDRKTIARSGGARAGRSARPTLATVSGAVFVYDEWDHLIEDYRQGWCRLREIDAGDDAGLFFSRTLARYAPLVPEIRRHFQRVRPESWRKRRSLEDGEDFDLAAVIDARAELRARRSPSPKLYTARVRLEREVATLFLLDMSASTDEAATVAGESQRIIDIEKAALVIMAAALEEIGDAFAIYGFSGQGRHNVEFYRVKEFNERLAAGARGRIGGIQPRCSTRMGTALRHAIRKMHEVRAPNRHLILISDGFPQDLDYGDDRRSHGYGISDTAVALREVEAAGIKPFCITVDLAGHDYLRRMCDPGRYMIIENVPDLPRELPKIYQRLVRAA